MRIDDSDPEKLLAAIGDGPFTLKGTGVLWPFTLMKFRAVGLTPDGKGIALEIVPDNGPTE